MFVINCKNYEEISGDKIIKFIKIAEQVSKKHKIKIASIEDLISYRVKNEKFINSYLGKIYKD